MKDNICNQNSQTKIGEQIRTLRKERGLTQAELAGYINVSLSAIAMYETGGRVPNNTIKEKLCKYFDCDLNYLYGVTYVRNSLNSHKTPGTIPVYSSLFIDGSEVQGNQCDSLTFPMILTQDISFQSAFAIICDSDIGYGINKGDLLVFLQDNLKDNDIAIFIVNQTKHIIRKCLILNNINVVLLSDIPGEEKVLVNIKDPNSPYKYAGKLIYKISKY